MDDNIEELFDLNFMEFQDFCQAKNELKKMNFRCLCLNTRSLRNNWDVFCARICPIINYIEITVLVEINIKIEENSLYHLDGFCAEFANRKHKKGGGRAMLLIVNRPPNHSDVFSFVVILSLPSLFATLHCVAL